MVIRRGWGLCLGCSCQQGEVTACKDKGSNKWSASLSFLSSLVPPTPLAFHPLFPDFSSLLPLPHPHRREDPLKVTVTKGMGWWPCLVSGFSCRPGGSSCARERGSPATSGSQCLLWAHCHAAPPGLPGVRQSAFRPSTLTLTDEAGAEGAELHP